MQILKHNILCLVLVFTTAHAPNLAALPEIGGAWESDDGRTMEILQTGIMVSAQAMQGNKSIAYQGVFDGSKLFISHTLKLHEFNATTPPQVRRQLLGRAQNYYELTLSRDEKTLQGRQLGDSWSWNRQSFKLIRFTQQGGTGNTVRWKKRSAAVKPAIYFVQQRDGFESHRILDRLQPATRFFQILVVLPRKPAGTIPVSLSHSSGRLDAKAGLVKATPSQRFIYLSDPVAYFQEQPDCIVAEPPPLMLVAPADETITAAYDDTQTTVKTGNPGPLETAETFQAEYARQLFNGFYQLFGDLMAYSAKVPDGYPHKFPPDMEDDYRYKRELALNYLRIDDLYQARRPLLLPGPPEPFLNPEKKALTDDHMFTLARVYLGLMQSQVPAQRGRFAARINWPDPRSPLNPKRLYFQSAVEENQVANALTQCRIREQRQRIRDDLMARVDTTLAVLGFLPGGSLTEDLLGFISGKNVKGETLSVMERLLAVGNSGAELFPILMPALKKIPWRSRALPGLKQLNNRMSRRAVERLQAEADRNFARAQFARTADIGQRERVMTNFVTRLYDRFNGVRYRSLQLGNNTGIDMVVEVDDLDVMFLDELKYAKDFDGDFAGDRWQGILGEVSDIRLPGLDGRVARQASMSWFLHRAIRYYNSAKRAGNPANMAAAKKVILKIAAGKVRRRILIMNKNAELYETFADLHDFINEIQTGDLPPASSEQLRDSAKKWLAENPR